MKKLLAIIAGIIIIAIIVIFFAGIGLGPGAGGGADSTSAAEEQQENPAVDDTESPKAPEDSQDETILEVSVVKSEYFFENRSIDLNALLDEIKKTEGNLLVEITDDKAALRAYNQLIDALEDLSVPYEEVSLD